jgi:integrase
MIIKSKRVKARGPALQRTLRHLADGEDNERVELLRGDLRDLQDARDDALGFGREYAVRHWILAPEKLISNDQLDEHAMSKGWLKHDPSIGIKRPKVGEIRAWTDAELAAYERRWPIGTKQRTAYALMLNMGTARIDTHLLTWHQVDDGACYRRHKTGVDVDMAVSEDLAKALASTPRKHVCVLVTEWGKPFTVDGFSGFMRDAIKGAGITDLTCRPHGLRKTLGRLLADAGCSAHDIMAALGHKTLAEAERYTREADRKRGGKRAVVALDEHRANKPPQTTPKSLGKIAKTEGETTP